MARLSALVRRGIVHQAVNLPPLMLFRDEITDPLRRTLAGRRLFV